jgi:hypothetical protein
MGVYRRGLPQTDKGITPLLLGLICKTGNNTIITLFQAYSFEYAVAHDVNQCRP